MILKSHSISFLIQKTLLLSFKTRPMLICLLLLSFLSVTLPYFSLPSQHSFFPSTLPDSSSSSVAVVLKSKITQFTNFYLP